MADEGAPNIAESFECPICQKQFAIRSSYLRHSRKCLERTVSHPRKKSCRQCSSVKTRCDQKRPCCTRCAVRSITCEYAIGSSQRQREQSTPQTPVAIDSPNIPSTETTPENTQPAENNNQARSTRPTDQIDHLGWGNLAPETRVAYTPITPSSKSAPSLQHDTDLIQPNDRLNPPEPEFTPAEDPVQANVTSRSPAPASGDIATLRERWLYPYVEESPARHAVKKQSVSFLSRIFRTYPRMMSRREQLPPFIHTFQVSYGSIPPPLANCFLLSRMWEGHTPTDEGIELIETTIKREMKKLFNEYRTYSPENLTAAFQALLIYSIILLFFVPQQPSSGKFDLPNLVSLQELGFYVCQRDLVLPAETAHTRPSWEEWVLVSCRRRTLMTLYCFEWIYAMLNGLPTFPCTELGFMPAPAGKLLWSARSQQEWEDAYDRWLGHWAGMGAYKVLELTQIKPGPELDLRSEMWLEEADEFGIMYMALVNATEGPHLTERG